MNIQVPFLFKHAVDHLNSTVPLMDTVAGTAMTLTTALLLGCKFKIQRAGMERTLVYFLAE